MTITHSNTYISGVGRAEDSRQPSSIMREVACASWNTDDIVCFLQHEINLSHSYVFGSYRKFVKCIHPKFCTEMLVGIPFHARLFCLSGDCAVAVFK